MKQNRTLIALALVLALAVSLLAGCSMAPATESANLLGGMLRLKVNPEIYINYDAEGNVTGLTAGNDDAIAILSQITGFEGKPTQDVVAELVSLIGQAGYFIDDVDGHGRTVTLEVEKGSFVPDELFLERIAEEVRREMAENAWENNVDVRGETPYDQETPYGNTDYGPDSDGETPFDPTTPYDQETPYDATTPYDPETPYDAASPYDPETPYDATSPYDPETPYDATSPYDPETPYDATSPYDPETPYDKDSPYGDSDYRG